MSDGEMFKKIVENMAEMVYLLNERGQFLYASKNLCDVMPVESGQLLGRTIEEFIHPDDVRKYRMLLNRLSGSPAKKGRIESRFKQKNGTWRWYLSNITLQEGKGEKDLTYVATCYDVTYSKRTINTIKKRWRIYQGLFEQCSEALILVDIEEKKIIKANGRFLDMFGYNKCKLRNLTLYDLIPCPYIEKTFNCLSHITASEGFQKVEGKWLRSDGSQIDVELAISSYETGNNSILLVNIRNITEIKQNRLSASLHEITMEIMSQNKLADIIKIIVSKACQLCNASGGFCLLINEDNAMIENVCSIGIGDGLNDSVLSIDEGIVGMLYHSESEILLQDYAAWKGRVLHKCFDNMGSTIGLPLKKAAGKVIGVIVVTHLNKTDKFKDEDMEYLKNFAYVASILTDNIRLNAKLQNELLQRRTVEKTLRQNEEQMQQMQKMEALGTLAGGIAHDFNNILTGIIGYAELSLEDAPKDSMMYQSMLEVINLGARAKELVSRILAFSRKTVIKSQLIDLAKVLKETIRMLRATLPSTISIKEEYRYAPAVLYADSTEMQQLIMNLSINAEYAMREKGGILKISVDKVESKAGGDIFFDWLKPGDYVKISIEDTGCGMNKYTMERIFEPFFTTKGLKDGTGLGLSVVHGIVVRHKGTITVESELGKGSIFNVFLPLADEVPASY